MYFSGTYFFNFRNLCEGRREWSPAFNLITGPNGAGKTNFLEGLNILSGWGPFDGKVKISSLVKWGNESSSLWGRIRGEESADISANLGSRCALKRDGKTAGASETRRRMPVLSFMPRHMSLIKGGSSCRRQLLDRIGVLVSVPYARILHDYRTVLRQKSAMLRKMRDPRPADRVLAPLGSWLWSAREEIIRMLSGEMDNFPGLLPRSFSFFFQRGGGGVRENASDDFRISLEGMRDKERYSRTPLVGPQRDDVKFMCGGVEASAALSRGQSRKVVSALILASSLAVERRLGKKPVLLFDEITSELDESGKASSAEAILRTGCQIFAATADSIDHRGVEIHRMRDGRFL
ncbi:MAG: DNA replication and repair protein RecF [Synergistaceae bacterium]|jgi:DNA replication and repair protein RecF|nr:DNA replication and repair protein RecF [Synergistaceae bacterium]